MNGIQLNAYALHNCCRFLLCDGLRLDLNQALQLDDDELVYKRNADKLCCPLDLYLLVCALVQISQLCQILYVGCESCSKPLRQVKLCAPLNSLFLNLCLVQIAWASLAVLISLVLVGLICAVVLILACLIHQKRLKKRYSTYFLSVWWWCQQYIIKEERKYYLYTTNY